LLRLCFGRQNRVGRDLPRKARLAAAFLRPKIGTELTAKRDGGAALHPENGSDRSLIEGDYAPPARRAVDLLAEGEGRKPRARLRGAFLGGLMERPVHKSART